MEFFKKRCFFGAVPQLRGHEADATVAALGVVPLHQAHRPLTGDALVEAVDGEAGAILGRAEQAFYVGIVVAYPGRE